MTREATCEGCLLQHQCAYSTFFESPAPPEQAARRYSALPHPFVLEPPTSSAGALALPSGKRLSLGVTLIGPAIDQLPYLIHAIQRAGQIGLGQEQGRFRLLDVEQETPSGSGFWEQIYSYRTSDLTPLRRQPPALPACPASAHLDLLTPLRIKRDGRFVNSVQLNARTLFGSMAARVSLLSELYGEVGSASVLDRKTLHQAIEQIDIEQADLRWVNWTRYSSRQRATMQFGGLLGSVQITGPGLPTLWPLITIGQWLHLGKNTGFGLGRYRIRSGSPATQELAG